MDLRDQAFRARVVKEVQCCAEFRRKE